MQVGKERKNTKWPRKNWLRWQWLLDLFQTDWFPITPSGPDFAAKPIETMNNYGQINLAGKFPILSKSTHIHYTLLFFTNDLSTHEHITNFLALWWGGAPFRISEQVGILSQPGGRGLSQSQFLGLLKIVLLLPSTGQPIYSGLFSH